MTNHGDLSSIASAAENIESRFAQVDVLVNNAGCLIQNFLWVQLMENILFVLLIIFLDIF